MQRKEKKMKLSQTTKLAKIDIVILYILLKAREKGIKDLSKFQIMKILYMIEAEAHRYIGTGLLGISFNRDENGPISTEIYDSLDKLKHKNLVSMEETKVTDYPHPRHGYSLAKKVGLPIQDTEKVFLNSVIDSYIELNQKRLKEIVYNTEPMREITSCEDRLHRKLKGSKINFDSIPLDEDIVEILTN